MRIKLVLAASLIFFLAFTLIEQESFQRKEKLSEYNFFIGAIADLKPNIDLIPYSVNTPLFSNYAEKVRFIKFPEGSTARYSDSSSFEFPIGTVLIKTFYYPFDFRKPEKGTRILETRLLVHETKGWQAYPYTWNDEQTDAYYDPAGELMSITYVNSTGKKISAPYLIPNKNQCKGCHLKGDKMVPIGTTARQLNRNYKIGSETVNQLEYLREHKMLDTLPANAPKLAVWNDASSGSLNDRARAYLDANCGHCHTSDGPANTSGLYLDIFEQDEGHLGVKKTPVAAGRGTGNLQFDIKPGDPENSILIFRMNTNDPAIAMPEIGREQVHEEAVVLLEEWIRKNTFRNN
jgi:uncharacterized repeat protein (TIGR03806 family)